MQFKTTYNQKLPFFVALGLLSILASCGSYQYAGYDNDGIYSSGRESVVVENVKDVTTTDTNATYYKNYFSQNQADVETIQEQNEIFTDIDAYEGTYTDSTALETQTTQAYGGWGDTSESITINYINNGWGWNNPLWTTWGYGWPYGGWYGGWGGGWGGWGYGDWYGGWGWGGWGWGAGWGYGGWYGGWGYPGWGYPGWGYNGYYGHNRYAYSNTQTRILFKHLIVLPTEEIIRI